MQFDKDVDIESLGRALMAVPETKPSAGPPTPPPGADPRKDRPAGQLPEATILFELMSASTFTEDSVECHFRAPQPEAEDVAATKLDWSKMGVPQDAAKVLDKLMDNAAKAVRPPFHSPEQHPSSILMPLPIYNMLDLKLGDYVTISIRKHTD